MVSVEVDNYAQWRSQARALLQRGYAPADVNWQTSAQPGLGLRENAAELQAVPARRADLRMPRRFFKLARHVACFRDDARWSLLYSVAWRLLFENRDLLDITMDAQVNRLVKMEKAVLRDKHKMEAFVRFRRVTPPPNSASTAVSSDSEGNDYFVAWFRPQHLIVEPIAPFFAKRFANMRWSILTPDACAHWDTQRLSFTEGVPRSRQAEDQLEALWLAYYKHIFNPSRLKLKAMQAEMPKKYWADLPEASLIADLARTSRRRMDFLLHPEDDEQ